MQRSSFVLDARPPSAKPRPIHQVALHDEIEIDFEEYARSRLHDFAKR